jgi:hypothetical protein
MNPLKKAKNGLTHKKHEGLLLALDDPDLAVYQIK